VKSSIHHPKISRTSALAGVLATSTAYALILSTPAGRRWAQEQTWATVAAGVTLVAAWMAAEERHAGTHTILYFSVAGVPMIARSLWLQLGRIDAIIERAMTE
jgi:hypothetical protein